MHSLDRDNAGNGLINVNLLTIDQNLACEPVTLFCG